MDNIKIRLEETNDYRAVEELTRDAFWNLYTMGASEHLMVHNLRKSEDYIQSLSFIATINNEIVGSVFYSKSIVVDELGNIYPSITIAPISVNTTFQKNGIGSKLINHSINEALKQEYKAIVIYGDPEYYKRFGFVGSKNYKISAIDGKYYKSLLVLELEKGYFSGIKKNGKFSYSPVFDITPDEVDKFDAYFPAKEKLRTKSQEEFEKLINILDE